MITAAPTPASVSTGRPAKASSDKALLARVELAWPTLGLLVLSLGLWLGATTAALLGWIPMALGVVANCIAAYVAFTPMHDASHQAVGTRSGLNAVVGRLAAIPLLAPFLAFRYVHLEHHKHTNETDGSDPDMWSGRGPWWALPLRWLTQDLHYYVVYATVLTRRPRREVAEVTLTLVAVYGTLGAFVAAGYGLEVVLLALLPARVAIGLLAFAFDYLPHAPYVATRSEDRYRATRIIDHRSLTPILLGQNYHLVHHLYPAVPWYRYGRVWAARRKSLVARGAVAVRLR